MRHKKPNKKNDKEIWDLISKLIKARNYIFVAHAKKRLKDRSVTDIDVLDILENKDQRKSKRNKKKDTYIPDYKDWNYCIEGSDLDDRKIRVIISFNEDLLLVITVIRLDESE